MKLGLNKKDFREFESIRRKWSKEIGYNCEVSVFLHEILSPYVMEKYHVSKELEIAMLEGMRKHSRLYARTMKIDCDNKITFDFD